MSHKLDIKYPKIFHKKPNKCDLIDNRRNVNENYIRLITLMSMFFSPLIDYCHLLVFTSLNSNIEKYAIMFYS